MKLRLSLLLLLFSVFAYADERTDVIVIGRNASAMAAGVQSARSGVKTIWVNPAAAPGDDLLNADTASTISAGLWPEILKKIKEKSTANRADILKQFTDTVKNLKVYANASIRKIERNGKGWEIKLNDGRELKCLVLVDAENHTQLVEKTPAEINQRIAPASIPVDVYSSRLFRTAIAVGNGVAEMLPMGALLSQTENYVFAPAGKNVAASMLGGQAAGASAAYCAFFKTTTKAINVRLTQGELLRYNGQLLPVADMTVRDTAYISVQHVLATGILKTQDGNFNPHGTLTSEELRLPMKEYFSRSQLWFINNKRDSLSVEDAINLIMFTATRGEELRREIQNGWKTSLKLSGTYDPKRAITRREFAVLLDRFLQPFSVRVDFAGNLLR